MNRIKLAPIIYSNDKYTVAAKKILHPILGICYFHSLLYSFLRETV